MWSSPEAREIRPLGSSQSWDDLNLLEVEEPAPSGVSNLLRRDERVFSLPDPHSEVETDRGTRSHSNPLSFGPTVVSEDPVQELTTQLEAKTQDPLSNLLQMQNVPFGDAQKPLDNADKFELLCTLLGSAPGPLVNEITLKILVESTGQTFRLVCSPKDRMQALMRVLFTRIGLSESAEEYCNFLLPFNKNAVPLHATVKYLGLANDDLLVLVNKQSSPSFSGKKKKAKLYNPLLKLPKSARNRDSARLPSHSVQSDLPQRPRSTLHALSPRSTPIGTPRPFSVGDVARLAPVDIKVLRQLIELLQSRNGKVPGLNAPTSLICQ